MTNPVLGSAVLMNALFTLSFDKRMHPLHQTQFGKKMIGYTIFDVIGYDCNKPKTNLVKLYSCYFPTMT